MRSVESYRRLAPFTARELIESANALLAGRDRLAISERTLRYYISQKLLPSPEGPPKLSRYSFSHLVALIAIRGLQDRGVSLDRIRDELIPLWRPENESALRATIAVLDVWLGTDFGPLSEQSINDAFRPLLVQEQPQAYSGAPPAAPSYVRRSQATDAPDLDNLRGLRSQVEELRQTVLHQRGRFLEVREGPVEPTAIQRLQEEVREDRERTRAGFEEIHHTLAELTIVIRELQAQIMENRSDESS